jgi:hypothetical protein
MNQLEDRGIKWNQQAHVWWLRDGDINTFYTYASTMKKRNRVKGPRRQNGTMVEEGELKHYVSSFFQKLFTSSVGDFCTTEIIEKEPSSVTANG